MNTETMQKAALLWDYLGAGATQQACDAIVVCCSYDLRVCDHACDLVKAGYAQRLVLSGDSGHWTRHLWAQPEAEVFAERALANGIAADQLLIENQARNFGENIVFSRALLGAVNSVTLVTKPNALLRASLTAAAQWPEVLAHVSSPTLAFPAQVSNLVGVLGVIAEMVGDIERIQKYPALGYQAAHQFPDEVLQAWQYLVEQGFTTHLMQQS